MGLTTISMSFLNQGVSDLQIPWSGMKMLELGNQYLYLDPPSNIPHKTPAKEFFERRGVDHVSVDLNGMDGSLVKDLSTPFDLGKTFDVVTNFGTAEHVSDVYECLANIHNHCRVGGLMVHAWPKHGHWPGHGFHYAEQGTFHALAELCNYQMIYIGTHAAMGNTTDGIQIHTNLVRTSDSPFPSREQFDRSVQFFKD